MRRFLTTIRTCTLTALVVIASITFATPARAAASMSARFNAASISVGDTVTITVSVNTGGDSTNAYEGRLSYPSNLFDPIRGSSAGSVCSIFVTQPNPDGGVADFACGNPTGFNGTGKVIDVVLQAKSAGTGSAGLSACSVLANDGLGTDITGGCSGDSITVTEKATPTPVVATATPTPTSNAAAAKRTPPPASATPAPAQTAKAAESAKPTAAATAEPTPPPAQTLPPETPTPSAAVSSGDSGATGGTTSTDGSSTDSGQRRTVAGAFQDLLSNARQFKLSKGSDSSGLIAILLTMFPLLGVLGGIIFFAYRLYLLEHHRRRRMALLFEAQLAELAALEGKMDLLAEKGTKGREQYRDEFQQAKERILRQVNPNYAKQVGKLPEESESK